MRRVTSTAIIFVACVSTADAMILRNSTAFSLGGLGQGGASSLFDGTTIATWWGGGQAQGSLHQLDEVCQEDVDLIGVSFYNGTNPPSLELGAYSWTASEAQIAAGFPGLKDLTAPASSVAQHVKDCQAAGKTIVLTLGGDSRWANTTFSSQQEAQDAAHLIWNLFLGGTENPELRPFGQDVVLDGLDIDNEEPSSKYYLDFVTTLRSLMLTDAPRRYLIGATPWVGGLGDDTSKISIPIGILGLLDYVAVQFYNADDGGLGTNNFQTWLERWVDAIHKANPSTKMLFGVMVKGAGNDGPWAHGAADMKKRLKDIVAQNLPGFGGAAIWEAGAAMNSDENYFQSVATAIGRIKARR
ncbi:hypothetical protein G7054_g2053 [Neopestalotiopsis clavispora]|nr:hypothetical protein G7054_g2053 [Neopestalotiopsis clavispora]